jgi:flavin reductase (DIM6/NTAB) family NADH-FMN oxidoreductase RutF
MMAIAANDYAQRFLKPDAKFILNILKEGRTVRRHFSHAPQPGENPFDQVAHRTGKNGCLILTESLAYLECTVQSWMRSGDHWLVSAIVREGDVLEDNGVAAIQQRKSGSQY